MSLIERRRSALFGVAITVSAVGCAAATSTSPGAPEDSEGPLANAEAAQTSDAVPTALAAPGPLVAACGARYVAATGSDTSTGGVANDCRTRRKACATIQHAVDSACAGDTVNLARGTYRENVVLAKALTLTGPRAAVIEPALSAPAPCTDSSLCDGKASSVVLVQASGVTVSGITIDGDNTTLTSGASVGGADIDARNGIITDYAGGRRVDGLNVRNVRVQNVYLRGIYASSGGTFTFANNLVRNVLGDGQSVGIFNYGGSGTITDNEVDDSADAITANHSTGTTFSDNVVRRSASGVHTDNAGDLAGSTGDTVTNNRVLDCTPDGIGVWVFVPFLPPSVTGNTVQRCATGLAAFGQGAEARTPFTGNRVVAGTEAGSVGAFISTDQMGFGEGNVSVLLSGNVFRGAVTGLAVEEGPGFVADAQITCNTIQRGTTGIVVTSTLGQISQNTITGNTLGLDATAIMSGTVDARQNWWGCAAGPGGRGCDTVTGPVDASSPLPAAPSASCPASALTAATATADAADAIAEKWDVQGAPAIVAPHGTTSQAKHGARLRIAVPGGGGSRSQ